jgi:uncharacterized protein YidB (DUF937 family)
MGLLEDLLGQLGGGAGMGRQPLPRRSPQPAPGANGGMSRVLMALLPVVLSMLARRQQRRQDQRLPGDGAGAGGGGGLGDILGGMLGGGSPSDLGPSSGNLGPGGLGDLLERFERAGFGRQAQSWVAVGPSDSIPADAVEKVFGPGALAEIARRAGLSERETAQGMAQLLPEVVDHVTPDGTVPDSNSLLASVEALSERMKLLPS